MKALTIAVVLCFAGPQEELDKATKALLANKITMVMEGTSLPNFLGMLEGFMSLKLPIYVDREEVKDPNAIKITTKAEATLDEILKAALAESKLVHVVWQGAVVISTEKGVKAFKETAWSGLTLKAVEAQKELSKKLTAVHTFEWSPYDPVKALEVLEKASGVKIKADAVARMEKREEEENAKLLFPRTTTLYGALVFLSRATGITFAAEKDGSLTAKAPAAKK